MHAHHCTTSLRRASGFLALACSTVPPVLDAAPASVDEAQLNANFDFTLAEKLLVEATH